MSWDKVRASNTALKERLARGVAYQPLHRIANPAPAAVEPRFVPVLVEDADDAPLSTHAAYNEAVRQYPEQPMPPAEPVDTSPAPDAPAAASGSIEHRRAPRKRQALSALILWEDNRTGIPCTVVDMSVSGARLHLSRSTRGHIDPNDLPDAITLYVKADRLSVQCAVVRRSDADLGVRFTSMPTTVK